MAFLNKHKNLLIGSIITLILAIISLFSTYLSLYDGLPYGHDTHYHFSNIYDEYLNLLEGNSSPISANLASGLGIGKQLFYSPLPHKTVALVGVILSPFGISLIDSFKFVVFMLNFISGIFMYKLGKKLSNGNMVLGIIAAALFILNPYRIFDLFCRFAFAEVYSFVFMPIFFLGLYDLVHMEKINIKPYVCIILGAAGLFLSHNITALYMYVFGVLYLLLHPVKIYNILKNRLSCLYSILSVILIIGLVSINLFTQLELMNSNLYNLTIKSRMYTDLEHVLNQVNNAKVFSGFLNIEWLAYYYPQEASENLLIFGMCAYVLLTAAYIIIDIVIYECKKFNNNIVKNISKFHTLISSIIYILFVLLLIGRLEIVLASIVVVMIYSVFSIFKSSLTEEDSIKKPHKEVAFIMVSLIITLLLIFKDTLWKFLPSLFLNIQFPWRLWALIGLFISMLVPAILSYFKDKRVSIGLGVISVGFMLVVNQILPEKRLTLESNTEAGTIDDSIWVYSIDDTFFTQPMSIGANGEYLPQMYYYYIPKYEPEYAKSLYNQINYQLFMNIGKNPYEIDPIALEGEATINTTYKKAPVYKMEITVDEEALIHIPLIYYDGYQITILNTDTNKTTVIDAIEVDGLVAFRLQKGNYVVSTNFVGTPIRQFSKVFSNLSIVGLAVLVAFDMQINEKKKKSELLLYKG